jgi:uncharacterized OsmC-like protein
MTMMKTAAILASIFGSVAAFAPVQTGTSSLGCCAAAVVVVVLIQQRKH